MGEPFKNFLSAEIIEGMGRHFVRVAPDFDAVGFVEMAVEGLEALALKERSRQITASLGCFLPDDYEEAVDILLKSLDGQEDLPISEMEVGIAEGGIRGWPIMPMADYIAEKGMGAVPFSMMALKKMTMRSSSEFAIRPFLVAHQAEVLGILSGWVEDENEHVRRLVSEGTRPRLPWGMRLGCFVDDPLPVVALLERLKDDGSEYVRRSVANSLNDISKDHVDLVAEIAVGWMVGADKNRHKLVKHGLRSLVKSGHKGALAALGYGRPEVDLLRFEVLTPVVKMGAALEFEMEIVATGEKPQPLIIDYAVYHQKANGKIVPKVFKWKNVVLGAHKGVAAKRLHKIRLITTRRYYEGLHRVEILVNGEALGIVDFMLEMG